MKYLVALAAIAVIWRFGRRPETPAMREARALLGVRIGASVDEIRIAHRRLISRAHPDAGGSVALAGRVNAARDLLVMELNRSRA